MEDYHVDMSVRLYEEGNTGIACVAAQSKEHNGCALSGRDKKKIDRNLCSGSIFQEHAKLYAIIIYYLIKNKLHKIKTLIICNDEDFVYVKEYLLLLLNGHNGIEIINITEFQRRLGRKVKSLADNQARHYRKRALKRNKWHVGVPLDVVDITYNMIESKWEELKNP
jgi:hypothetical protein